MQQAPLVIVSTTLPSLSQARHMAEAILKARWAACVQYSPIRSQYWWQGKITSASEYLVQAKTRAALAQSLLRFIKHQHPYSVPEIIVPPILALDPSYRRWLEQETQAAQRRRPAGPSGRRTSA